MGTSTSTSTSTSTTTTKHYTHGGARPYAGRTRKHITLSEHTAKLLRLIVQVFRMEQPNVIHTPDTVVDELIIRLAYQLHLQDEEYNAREHETGQ